MITYEVSQSDINKIKKKLDNVTTQGPRVIRNAINRTATSTLKKIKAGRSAGYTIKASAFNGEITTQRATNAHLDATIKASGKPRTVKEFKISKPKSGVKTDIVKSGLKKLVNNAGAAAFVGTGGQISGLVAQREGKSRYPLRVPTSNSVPKMVEQIYLGNRGNQSGMDDYIRKELHDQILAEIKKLI